MDREEADSSRKELGRSAQRYFGLARRLLEIEIERLQSSDERDIDWNNNIFTYPDANDSIAARTAVLMLLG